MVFLKYLGNAWPHSSTCDKHLFISHFQSLVYVSKASLKSDDINQFSIFFCCNLRPRQSVEGELKLCVCTVGNYCYMGIVRTNIECTNNVFQEVQHLRPSCSSNASR